MTGDIIDFPGGRSVPRSARVAEDLEVFLRTTARLPLDYRPILARNLGMFALLLDPQRPLVAAKRMFSAAFGWQATEKWRKRHRLIRLPDEAAPEAVGQGDYEASGRHYLQLAQAFSRLHDGHGSFSVEDAARMLLKDTPHNPQVHSVSLGDQAIEDEQRVREELSRIEAAALAAPIGDAFRILSSTPIDRVGPGEWKVNSLRENPKGDLRQLETDDDEFPVGHWLLRPVQIGFLHILTNEPAWVIAGNIDSDLLGLCSLAFERWCKEEKARSWLAVLRDVAEELIDPIHGKGASKSLIDRTFMPDRSGHTECFIQHGTVYVTFKVFAFLFLPKVGGGPQVVLRINRSPYRSVGIDIITSDSAFTIVDNFEEKQLESINNVEGGVLALRGETEHYIQWDESGEGWKDLLSIPLSSILDQVEQVGYSRLGDSDLFEVLTQEGSWESSSWEPTIWDDSEKVSPAPAFSPAATLLRNARFAPPGERLVDLLRAPLLEDAQSLMDFYRREIAVYSGPLPGSESLPSPID